MNLKNLSDNDLNCRTKESARKERRAVTELLHHLREVERRRLFSKFKYSSLFQYVVEELKYPEDQANYRISAMRLMREVPEVEQKIESGALSLTNLVAAKVLFSKEKKAGREFNKEQKTEVLLRLENRSVREARKIVAEINPEMSRKNWDPHFDTIEDEALREKLLQVKGLYAHSHPNLSLKELLHLLCDRELERKSKSPLGLSQLGKSQPARVNSEAEIRRRVWRRDKGKCVKCGSSHAPQVEHIIPRAAGGQNTLENMCVLCRSCNQRAAIEYFGMKKMSRYLKSPENDYVTIDTPDSLHPWRHVRRCVSANEWSVSANDLRNTRGGT